HEDQGQTDQRSRWVKGVRRDELGQKGEKEQRQLRIQNIEQSTIGSNAYEACLVLVPCNIVFRNIAFRHFHQALVVQYFPGHVEQVDHTKILDELEGEGTGVQQGSQANDAGQCRRNDPQGAAESCSNTGF